MNTASFLPSWRRDFLFLKFYLELLLIQIILPTSWLHKYTNYGPGAKWDPLNFLYWQTEFKEIYSW